MAKMRDFTTFWMFYTLFVIVCTILGLLLFNRLDNSHYEEIITQLEKDLAACEQENVAVRRQSEQVKSYLDKHLEDTENCFKDFWKVIDHHGSK